MKKYTLLLILTFILTSCGKTESEPAKKIIETKIECPINYSWNGKICKGNTKKGECKGIIGFNEVIMTGTITTYQQTWDGEKWAPEYFRKEGEKICGITCNKNYFWNGIFCEGNTKQINCGGKIPENATTTTEKNFSQKWYGTDRTPKYKWKEGQKICGFKCNENFTWNGNYCISNNKKINCNGEIPENATATTKNKFFQEWYGKALSSSLEWGEGQKICGFKCNENYSWEKDICKADSIKLFCNGEIPKNAIGTTDIYYYKVWNGTSWSPEIKWGINQKNCNFECKKNYNWNGTNCEFTGNNINYKDKVKDYIPLDNFIFIDFYIAKDGEVIEGKAKGLFIDGPNYYYNGNGKLTIRDDFYSPINKDLKIILGQEYSLAGAAGSGIASGVTPIYALPYDDKYREVKITQIDSEGTVYIEYNEEKIILKVNDSWEKIYSKIETNEYGKIKITTTEKITNYGLVQKSAIKLENRYGDY